MTPTPTGDLAPPDPKPFDPFPVLSSTRIYDSPWVGLRRDVGTLPDGSSQEHHVVEISNAVVVVPLLADGSIAFVGQYRYPHGRTHWELPAGRLAAGEAAADGARRELLEETGLEAEELHALPGFYPTNGISAHFAHAFVATGCRRTAPPTPDPAQQLCQETFTRAQAEALLDAGRLADGFTAIALMYALRSGHLG